MYQNTMPYKKPIGLEVALAFHLPGLSPVCGRYHSLGVLSLALKLFYRPVGPQITHLPSPLANRFLKFSTIVLLEISAGSFPVDIGGKIA